MIRNLLVSSLRALARNRFYSIVNVIGLTLGVASLILLFLYGRQEMGYDRHHENGDRIYRLLMQSGEEKDYEQIVTTNVADVILPEVPGIEMWSRVGRGSAQIHQGEDVFRHKVRYVEPAFFKMFTLPVLHGDPDRFLTDRQGVVLTQSLADKLFPGINPVGQQLEISFLDSDHLVRVDGVVEDAPELSSLSYELFLPFNLLYDSMYQRADGKMWNIMFSNTFIMVQKGVTEEQASANLQNVVLHFEEGIPWSAHPEQYHLQPLHTLHLNLMNNAGYPTAADAKGFLLLYLIGLTILVMAILNFTVLTLGNASTRYREIGVRKVLGAHRRSLITQMWFETASLVVLATLLALPLLELVLPAFRLLSGIGLNIVFDGLFVASIAGIAVLVILIAGVSPALVISGFPLIPLLKGDYRVGGRGGLRRLLLFTQLSISMVLVSVTLLMVVQYRYIQNRELGYNGEQLVTLDATSKYGLAESSAERLRKHLAQMPGVQDITVSACDFGANWNMIFWNLPIMEEKQLFQNCVDEHFLETTGIELAQGRNFDPSRLSDKTTSLLVNETFVREFGLEQPLGMTMPDLFGDAQIIGVVKDFNFNDLRTEIKPLVLIQDRKVLKGRVHFAIDQHAPFPGYVMLRLDGTQMATSMRAIEQIWREEIPEAEFQAHFVVESVEEQYQELVRWNRIIGIASLLAMVILILGVVGVATMQVARRTKEIGIRKVLGASIPQILRLLNREIALLVSLSALVALPVAWYFQTKWLAEFAFKTSAAPLILAASLLVVLLVSSLAVALLSLRIAASNPVRTLRVE